VTRPQDPARRPARTGRVVAVLVAAALLAPGALAQVAFDPESVADKGPAAPAQPLAVRAGGNGVYTVTVSDAADFACGAWTARTGVLHEAGAGRNVLYGNGQPSTSDTVLRSWTSGALYRTGGSHICTRLCDIATPTVQAILTAGVTTGWRMTWLIDDGALTIRFTQEVNVEGPVDGTETTDNTVIRETHVVENLGPATLRFGLRKHWDWQIGPDDGPWFGECETPTVACDRSMDMWPPGVGTPEQPRNYVINDDPDQGVCPPGVTPLVPAGCSGRPLYIVAGTVRPPSALVPPPDEPELLQFNRWDSVVGTCWRPSLMDAALCGALGNAQRDDTTIAYFYGLTSSSALSLGAGQSRSLTQYVVAGSMDCPAILDPPSATCDAGGPYDAECAGETTTLPIEGNGGSSSGDATVEWTTDCPGGLIEDPAAESTLLTLDSLGCAVQCSVTLTVTATGADGQQTTQSCSAPVSVVDTTGPVVTCPPQPLVVECSSGGARRTDPAVAAWLASASAVDECSEAALPVTNDLPAFVAFSTCPTTRTVTFRATDACGQVGTCTQQLVVRDTTPPVLTCPPDRDMPCGTPPADKAAWLASATATDSCAGDVQVSTMLVDSQSPCPDSVIETWQFTATDPCGNSASCTATWAEGDDAPPTLVGVPASTQLPCPEAVPPPPVVTATDACDPDPDVDFSESVQPGDCPDEVTVVRTWTATDRCGRQSQATQTISVVDEVPPALVGVPADRTVACDAVPAPAPVTATDACDPSPAVDFDEQRVDGDCPDRYVLVRTWTATER